MKSSGRVIFTWYPAGWVDGLAHGKLVGVFRPSLHVAENIGVERPTGVNVGFTEVDFTLGVWRSQCRREDR